MTASRWAPLGREHAALAAVVGAAGALGAWAGPHNGDFVAMLAQARAWDLADRVTHVGFVAMLIPVASLPWVVFPFASAALVAWVAWRSSDHPTNRWLALLAAAPLAPFPEVDPAWVAALATPGPSAVALAVAVSPAALLALAATPNRRHAWAALAAVILLSVGSGGDWWWGERGVSSTPGWAPGKVAAAWAISFPWLLLPLVRFDRELLRDLALSAPLLALPADVPGWVVPALRVAGAARLQGRSAWLVAQVVVTTVGLAATLARVHAENGVIAAAVADLGPDDGLVAPFSWGARASFLATGHPYGLRWHPPGGFLRDQQATWCAAPPPRVLELPAAVVRHDAASACPGPAPAWFTERAPAPPAARPAPPPGARSLVVVLGCTVRADQTSLGGVQGTTPFLASLAAAGTTFDDAVAAAPWTRPAATALFTGRHPLGVGMTDPAPGPDARRLPDAVVTLAEHLSAAGWVTVGVSANPNVHSRWGLDQGFERWREPAGDWAHDGVKLPGALAVDALRDALAGAPDPERPRLVVVVLVDAHAPFEATASDRVAFADDTVPALVVDYRSALRRFDAAAASAVAAAREALPDEPVVAIVSDHGEGLSFPAHHGWSHGRLLSPSVVRAVWVVAGPGVPAGAVSATVSQVDVAPTLASLAGAPGLPGEGRDLAPALRAGDVPGAAAFVDTWFREVDRAGIVTADRACALDLSGAPPDDGFVDGCFDRRADPAHEAPLAPDPALVDAVLRFRADHAGAAGEAARDDPAQDALLEGLGYR